MDNTLLRYAYAVRASGFARIPGMIGGDQIDALRELTDRALAAAMAVYRQRGRLTHTSLGPGYECARCIYCWGDAAVQLLDHPLIHRLAGELLGTYRLWDMSALSLTAGDPDRPSPAAQFHRDYGIVDTRVQRPPYLWFFVCLDATTPDNGATWIVPGSQHAAAPTEQAASLNEIAGGISVQLCAEAGDILVMDPTALHAAGQNRTSRPRRLVNLGLCRHDIPPLLDHWAIAGPSLQPRVSERVRAMLTPPDGRLDGAWDSLPPGWLTTSATATRST